MDTAALWPRQACTQACISWWSDAEAEAPPTQVESTGLLWESVHAGEARALGDQSPIGIPKALLHGDR